MLGTNAVRPRTAALVLALVGLPTAALAQGAGNDYCVRHTFRLRTPGNITPAVSLSHKERTFARTNTCRDNDLAAGTVGIGLGLTTRTVMSVAPGSTADATAEANITALGVGVVDGWVEARGNANPTTLGCPPPPQPRGSGRSTAFSAGQVHARGRYLDSRGNIRWSGNWKNSKPVAGSASFGIVSDPITATLIDHTTGLTSSWKLLSIKSHAQGDAWWDGLTFDSSAAESILDIDIPGVVTTQSGRLRVVARGGVITESIATGVFAATPVPAVGAPAGYSFPLPEISLDYDLGANPNNDVEVEIALDGAGETDKSVAADGGNVPTIITDLVSGFDSANTSFPLGNDATLGYNIAVSQAHVADDILILPGPPTQLEVMELPLFQINAPTPMPPQAVFVRLWNGRPGLGGAIIGGDMTTNRLMSSEFIDAYRVQHSNLLDPTRPIHNALVDLSWIPPLPPGRVWIEIGAMGMPGFGGPMVVPAPLSQPGNDDAMVLNVPANTWNFAQDSGSGRRVSMGWTVFSSRQQPTTCYANCDQSMIPPVLNVNDFTCFLNKFAAGDPYANCDQSTIPPVLNVNDFTCFLNKFAAGCD
ncbi:MAG: hypothetical protein JNM80_06955 [Phycisphaerae bacterium]|nr:hypothetical protein [Phycisphaerae bacterium]